MLFNSFSFVFLVILTMVIYYLPFLKKAQIYTVILASLVFYIANNPILLLLLLFSIIINIIASYLVIHGKEKHRKLYAGLGVALNILILFFFKYSPLIGKSFFTDSSLEEFLISIPLPIGISFFTFQGISLVIDSYKSNKIEAYKNVIVKSFLKHSTNTFHYISFFPQLVAGPIVKAHDFIPQIKTKFFSEINWVYSYQTLVLGYFLKMVVADNLKDYTYWITFPYFLDYSTLTLSTVLFGYSMQIFADFAGYSLIAIGVASLFGYRLKDNFNFPYISSSFSEFWKRWHISLSSFLKEYLYIPLGGNRKGKTRTYVNLMLTMLLGGFWHGAAWSYMVWGGFHGLALAIERFFSQYSGKRNSVLFTSLKTFGVFFFVSLAWLLFKLPEFNHVIEFLNALITNVSQSINYPIVVYTIVYSSPVILYHSYYLYKKHSEKNMLLRFEPLIFGLMLFLIVTNSGSSQEFIYFQF